MMQKMTEFTENDAIERIYEIGQAFANDLNDGDGPTLYEGLAAHDDGDNGVIFIFSAMLEDGREIEYVWHAKLASYEVKASKWNYED
jgi:hypothetical protein